MGERLVIPGSFLAKRDDLPGDRETFLDDIILLKKLCTHLDIIVKRMRGTLLLF